jgi:uncharacterized protein DUF4337
VASDQPKEPEAAPEKLILPKPPGVWGTILTTTPIVMTVLATIFAGLSSSEMTRSMFYRSLAAQQQSKAGDQWAFFQAKRIRGTSLETTVELLQSLAHPEPFELAGIDKLGAQMVQSPERATADNGGGADRIKKARERLAKLLADDKAKQTWSYLTGPGLPKIETHSLARKETQDLIDEVVKAIRAHQPESATAAAVGGLKAEDIEEASRLAEEDADHFDKACEPVSELLKELRAIIGELTASVRTMQNSSGDRSDGTATQLVTLSDKLNTSFKTAAMDFDARRYRQESSYNRRIAELYEVRVRRSGFDSDRHRERSKRFFYSMLIAQLGVTVSTLALARKQRSLLWTLAAAAGIIALSFSGYVYLSY